MKLLPMSTVTDAHRKYECLIDSSSPCTDCEVITQCSHPELHWLSGQKGRMVVGPATVGLLAAKVSGPKLNMMSSDVHLSAAELGSLIGNSVIYTMIITDNTMTLRLGPRPES